MGTPSLRKTQQCKHEQLGNKAAGQVASGQVVITQDMTLSHVALGLQKHFRMTHGDFSMDRLVESLKPQLAKQGIDLTRVPCNTVIDVRDFTKTRGVEGVPNALTTYAPVVESCRKTPEGHYQNEIQQKLTGLGGIVPEGSNVELSIKPGTTVGDIARGIQLALGEKPTEAGRWDLATKILAHNRIRNEKALRPDRHKIDITPFLPQQVKVEAPSKPPALPAALPATPALPAALPATPALPAVPPPSALPAVPPPSALPSPATSEPSTGVVSPSGGEVTVEAVKKILPSHVKAADRQAWAETIVQEIQKSGLSLTPTTVANVVATIGHESSFAADPKLTETASALFARFKQKTGQKLDDQLGDVLGSFADKEGIKTFMNTFLDTTYKKYEFANVKTEGDLFEKIHTHTEAILHDLGTQIDALSVASRMGATLKVKKEAVLNGVREKLGQAVSTLGPMQVTLQKALAMAKAEGRTLTPHEMRKELSTIPGGIHYGVQLMAQSGKAYQEHPELSPEEQQQYTFADYKAGQFSSRNAQFQEYLAQLTGQTLRHDGGLLRYQEDSDQPTADPGETEQAVQAFVKQYGSKYGLAHYNKEAIRAMLTTEKTRAFEQTPLYQAVQQAMQATVAGQPLRYAKHPEEPAQTKDSLREGKFTVAGYVKKSMQMASTFAQGVLHAPPKAPTEQERLAKWNILNQNDIRHRYGHLRYEMAKPDTLRDTGFKNTVGQPILMEKDATQALKAMVAAAAKENVNLTLISGFRTITQQRDMFEGGARQRKISLEEQSRIVAPDGYSEHGTGFSGDFADGGAPRGTPIETTKAYQWLLQHAKRFDFEWSFPPDNPQGVTPEAWHLRYVGSQKAKDVFKKARSLPAGL